MELLQIEPAPIDYLIERLKGIDASTMEFKPITQERLSAQRIHAENQQTAKYLVKLLSTMDDQDPAFDGVWMNYQRCVLAMDFAVRAIF